MLKDELGIKSTWVGRGDLILEDLSQLLSLWPPKDSLRSNQSVLGNPQGLYEDFALALAHLANSRGLSKELQDRKDLCSPCHTSAVHTKSHTAGLGFRLTSRVLVLDVQELISSKEHN